MTFKGTVVDSRMPAVHRFDPLSLAADERALKWFQQAELVHSRTAMTAVAGIIIPGVQLLRLSKPSALPHFRVLDQTESSAGPA